MIRLRFDSEKCNFSEVSEVSLFYFIGMPWNSSWRSVSRLTSLLSSFSIFSWATFKLVSTAVIRRFRLDSICERRRSTDWSNWNTSFSVGSDCAFCAIWFHEWLKVTFSTTMLLRGAPYLLLGCQNRMNILCEAAFSTKSHQVQKPIVFEKCWECPSPALSCINPGP